MTDRLPDATYRMLQAGDWTEPGDEAMDKDGEWFRMAVHGKLLDEDVGYIRRPLPAPPVGTGEV